MTKLRKKYRTIWISDVHLGTRGCKAEFLLDFLKQHDCETLYLVGDIIDGWRLRQRIYWPQEHTNVLRAILGYTKRGGRVVYIPGNHDEFARDHLDVRIGNIELYQDTVHTTADGRRLLVTHGDEFDGIHEHARWLCYLGDWAYTALLVANQGFNRIRRRFGLGYWSLSAYAKSKVKEAVNFIAAFETNLAGEAQRRGCDGVVCGHIHAAQIRRIGETTYLNAGDWVESCTALVEHFDATLEVIQWAQAGAADHDPRSLFRLEPWRQSFAEAA